MTTEARNFSGTLSTQATRLWRFTACFALLSLIPLWTSGALGDALSLGVVTLCWVAVSLLCIVVPGCRLDTTLRIVFSIASISVTIFLADYLLRTFASRSIYYRGHTEFLRKDSYYPTLPLYMRNAYSKRLSFGDLAAISGEPLDKVERLEIFQTDSRGFRNTPSSTSAPYDVIVVGDSFGMGLGVSQDEHWAALLTQQNYSVYNLSMPATCAAHGAARLTLEIPELELTPGATIIVPVYTGNDLEECAESVDAILSQGPQSDAQALITKIEDYRSRSPLRQLGMRLFYRFVIGDPVIERRTLSNHATILFYKPHIKAASIPSSKVESSPNFRNMAQALLRLHEIAKAHGARLAVVVIPTKEEIYNPLLVGHPTWPNTDTSSGFAEAVVSLCNRESISLIDLHPILSAEAKNLFPNGELLWWRDDSHWNELGHRLVARVIAGTLPPHKSSP